ncbi:MAG: glycyl-radical enzyme activating protein [Fidelibacterota bacterium]|nr:MAG: glycyl-radical enzyme activating protein [Candidatus Neomarinimicrobiota bacterium]
MHTDGQIFAIKRYAIHDGPGIRTTVFLHGCPLSCWWCHNPEGRLAAADSALAPYKATVDEVMAEVRQDAVFYEQSGGGVTFSGGEPLAQIDFLEALLQAARKERIATAVDTHGHSKYQAFERILDLVDLFLFDIKIFDNNEHKQHTGVSNELIFANLEALARSGRNIRVRIPLIPGVTDSDTNLTHIARYVAGLDHIGGIDLLPYNRLGTHKYQQLGIPDERAGLKTQAPEELEQMRSLVAGYGFTVNLGGGA